MEMNLELQGEVACCRVSRIRRLLPLLCVFSVLLVSSAWAAPLTVINPGFEAPIDRRADWRALQHAGARAYDMEVDDEVSAEGKRSFRIKRYAEQVYALVDQRIPARGSGGRTMRFSAMLRTEGVGPKGWMLMVNYLGESDRIIGQVRSEPMTGTTPWRRVTLEKQLPTGTEMLVVGAVLLDSGTGWVDDVELSLLGN
jgi:hypothetical protein